MELPLGDKVIQVLQRHGVVVSQAFASRIHGICHGRAPDTWSLQRLAVNHLKNGQGEPLSDFMCRHGIAMEELKKFSNPRSMAQHGPLTDRDFSRLFSQDVNSPLTRQCYAEFTNEQVTLLISDLKRVLVRHWQLRFVLGYGEAEWREFKRVQRGSQQSGDDDRRPWSKAKHLANLEFLRVATNTGLLPKVPLLFEACQGKGDATEKYRTSTVVVAAESDASRHAFAYQRTGATSLMLFTADGLQPGQVYMPDKATPAREVARHLQAMNVRFDVVDIDPFGSSLGLLPTCLPIMQTRALIMITLGDAANAPHGFESVASSLGMDLSSLPKSRLAHVKDRLSLVMAYRYLTLAAEEGVFMRPLLYLKAIEYHRKRITIDGRRGPVAGVDRLYCLALKDVGPTTARELLSGCAVQDPWVGPPVLWPSPDFPFAMVDFYEDLWDQEKNCLRETGVAAMYADIAQVCSSCKNAR